MFDLGPPWGTPNAPELLLKYLHLLNSQICLTPTPMGYPQRTRITVEVYTYSTVTYLSSNLSHLKFHRFKLSLARIDAS